MPYLPDGSWVDDEEYAEQQLSLLASQIPLSGTVAGTNYNIAPYVGGANLNLGWDQAPNFGAMLNFDPSAGLENAFISDYDISGSGMANVGDVSSPNAALSLTAGLEGTGLSSPDPYMQAAVTDVVPGLNAYTGTNVPSQATFSAGNLQDQGYSLGLNKFSGGPTEADFTMGLTPGVNLNLGTGQGGNVGVTASGAWEDIGKTARQLWGGVTDTLGNIISPAGAQTGTVGTGIEAASQAGAVQSKYGAGGYSGKIGPGDAYPMLMSGEEIITPTTAGMAEVYNPQTEPSGGAWGTTFSPEDSMATEEFDSDEEVLTPSGWMDLNVDPINDPTYDPMQHLDTIYGSITQPSVSPVTGEYQLHRDLAKIAPQVLRDMALNIKDTAKRADAAAPTKSLEKVKEDIQDVVNNIIGWDARKAGVDIRDAVKSGVNPTIVTDPKQFDAMAKLMQSGDASLQDSALELATQVEFTAPSVHGQQVAAPSPIPAAVPVRTKAITRQEDNRIRQEAKKAAEEQRKAALARQKAAADAQKEFNRLAAKATQQAAAARKSAAAQAGKAKKDLERFLSSRAYQEEGQPVPAHLIDLATQVDTFSGYGDRNGGAAGALGGYRGDPVGRQAAIESRGGGRNGGGRDHGGGHHGR